LVILIEKAKVEALICITKDITNTTKTSACTSGPKGERSNLVSNDYIFSTLKVTDEVNDTLTVD